MQWRPINEAGMPRKLFNNQYVCILVWQMGWVLYVLYEYCMEVSGAGCEMDWGWVGWCGGGIGEQRDDSESSMIILTDKKDGEPWCICRFSFTRPFLSGFCVFWAHPPELCWLISWRGVRCCYMMQVMYTVILVQLLISRCRCLVYSLSGECWYLCGSNLTWHDCPSLQGMKVMAYY